MFHSGNLKISAESKRRFVREFNNISSDSYSTNRLFVKTHYNTSFISLNGDLSDCNIILVGQYPHLSPFTLPFAVPFFSPEPRETFRSQPSNPTWNHHIAAWFAWFPRSVFPPVLPQGFFVGPGKFRSRRQSMGSNPPLKANTLKALIRSCMANPTTKQPPPSSGRDTPLRNKGFVIFKPYEGKPQWLTTHAADVWKPGDVTLMTDPMGWLYICLHEWLIFMGSMYVINIYQSHGSYRIPGFEKGNGPYLGSH